MRWDEFAATAPALAALDREAFEGQHLSILGTLHRDGWPRVSPCEIYFIDGELLLGMMPGSLKARDIQRDDRITVVNGQSERIPKRGDFKLYGRAVEVVDKPRRDRLADEQEKAIDWRPTDPFHVLAMDVLSASYISIGDDRRVMRWSPEAGLVRLRHPDDANGAGG